MAQIFHFKPKAELEAAQNLKDFVRMCRYRLTVFGEGLNWEHWEWKGAVQFTKLGTKSTSAKESDALNSDFMDFAKAYFRYQQGYKPTGAKNEIKALRVIEKALLQTNRDADISKLSIFVLDEAAQFLRDHYSKGSAYHGGRELERLAKFLSTNHLIPNDLSQWRNPIPRKKDEIQTGEKAKSRREKKLPSTEALNALAEIFSNDPQNSRDKFTSATFAMLMCAPSRITEVLELPVDCEVEEKDSKGNLRYGWRFYSGKGFGGDIKWIPSEMVSVARETIRRIKELSEEGRTLAKWIEENPSKFYRRKNLPNIDESTPLSEEEVCLFLGWSGEPREIRHRLKKVGWPLNLNQLWKFVMSNPRQPKDFPYLNKMKGIKYSQALFCMTTNVFSAKNMPHYPIIWTPTANDFNSDLNPRRFEGSSFEFKTLFDRHGYTGVNGERLKLTSHQARHLLNTIAQRGGLSNLEIAKWSGRADAKQNRVYNHMSEYEMVSRAEELDTSLSLFGPLGEVGKRAPISIQEFNILERGPVHVTEYGVCVHDFTMSPCEKFRDCLNCSEQVCVKGNDERCKRIKACLEEVEKQYKKAKEALEQGSAGADRWYEYHSNTLKRLRELVGILENPKIEDGTLIKLKNDKEFSPLRRAVASRLSDSKEKETKLLKNMTDILGGGLG